MSKRVSSSWRASAAGLVLVLVVAVCVWVVIVLWNPVNRTVRSDVPLVYDTGFETSLAESLDEGGQVLLSQLTTFDWKTVSVFRDGVTPSYVREELGVDLLARPYTSTEVLLVFCSNDSVVALRQYGYENLPASQTTYSADALIDSRELTEPSGRAVNADCAPPDTLGSNEN